MRVVKLLRDAEKSYGMSTDETMRKINALNEVKRIRENDSGQTASIGTDDDESSDNESTDEGEKSDNESIVFSSDSNSNIVFKKFSIRFSANLHL